MVIFLVIYLDVRQAGKTGNIKKLRENIMHFIRIEEVSDLLFNFHTKFPQPLKISFNSGMLN